MFGNELLAALALGGRARRGSYDPQTGLWDTVEEEQAQQPSPAAPPPPPPPPAPGLAPDEAQPVPQTRIPGIEKVPPTTPPPWTSQNTAAPSPHSEMWKDILFGGGSRGLGAGTDAGNAAEDLDYYRRGNAMGMSLPSGPVNSGNRMMIDFATNSAAAKQQGADEANKMVDAMLANTPDARRKAELAMYDARRQAEQQAEAARNMRLFGQTTPKTDLGPRRIFELRLRDNRTPEAIAAAAERTAQRTQEMAQRRLLANYRSRQNTAMNRIANGAPAILEGVNPLVNAMMEDPDFMRTMLALRGQNVQMMGDLLHSNTAMNVERTRGANAERREAATTERMERKSEDELHTSILEGIYKQFPDARDPLRAAAIDREMKRHGSAKGIAPPAQEAAASTSSPTPSQETNPLPPSWGKYVDAVAAGREPVPGDLPQYVGPGKETTYEKLLKDYAETEKPGPAENPAYHAGVGRMTGFGPYGAAAPPPITPEHKAKAGDAKKVRERRRAALLKIIKLLEPK